MISAVLVRTELAGPPERCQGSPTLIHVNVGRAIMVYWEDASRSFERVLPPAFHETLGKLEQNGQKS